MTAMCVALLLFSSLLFQVFEQINVGLFRYKRNKYKSFTGSNSESDTSNQYGRCENTYSSLISVHVCQKVKTRVHLDS